MPSDSNNSDQDQRTALGLFLDKVLANTLEKWREADIGIQTRTFFLLAGPLVALFGIMMGLGGVLLGEKNDALSLRTCIDQHTKCILENSELDARILTLEAELSTPTKTLEPTSTSTIKPTSTETPTATNTSIVTLTASITVTVEPDYSLVISEVIHVPDSADGFPEHERWNEYIEVFNYGSNPVDVDKLWISDGDTRYGQPDQIVKWTDRYSEYDFGEGVIIDSSVIPPLGYGLIISPKYLYTLNDQPYNDKIESGTVILTVAEQEPIENVDPDLLGDYWGLEGFNTSTKLDFVILYKGTRFKVVELISTYGAPDIQEGDSPFNIGPTLPSGFPKMLEAYGGVRRIELTLDDVDANWEIVPWGDQTPGY